MAVVPTYPVPGSAGDTPDADRIRAALGELRPGLVAAYDAALPGARAAVLARLLGALDREHLPGVAARSGHVAGVRRVELADGRVVEFPAGAAAPFAEAVPGLAAHLGAAGPDRAGDEAVADPTTHAHPRAHPNPAAVADPGDLVRALWPGAALAAEIDNSVANLALARAAAGMALHRGATGERRALAAATGEPDGLGRLEQLVVDGHPLHPCCRTRAGMSVADVLAYAPEHRPVIRLRRLRVPEDRWYGDGPPVLYAHPWQAARLRAAYPWMVDDDETGPARPLMSLRTVAPLNGGDHVKTAVDVQMTSAVRTVSPAAVHNGPRLSRLLAKLTADLPLAALPETAAGAVLIDGVPRRDMAHLVRRAPRVAPDEVILPLGADRLVAAAIAGDPHAWFEELAGILWAPLVTLLRRGVALEAHGQNTLLVLRAGRPSRILYRDLGGVRVSARRLRAAGVDPPELRGDLPTDDPAELRTKLAAAAIATVAAQLITTLTRRHGADPARLWAAVAGAIRTSGTPDAAALLTDPLPLKATTAMRLAADPLADLWTPLSNPLAAYA